MTHDARLMEQIATLESRVASLLRDIEALTGRLASVECRIATPRPSNDVDSHPASPFTIPLSDAFDVAGSNCKQNTHPSAARPIAPAGGGSAPDSEPAPSVPIVRADASDGRFSEFWKRYPKKTGKLAAQAAWLRRKPPFDRVLKALDWQTKSEQWTRDGGQYVPNPATWINQGRWDDEPPKQARAHVGLPYYRKPEPI